MDSCSSGGPGADGFAGAFYQTNVQCLAVLKSALLAAGEEFNVPLASYS